MQTCPQCRTQQLNGVLFCAECGASLFAETHRETTASLGQISPADIPLPVIKAAPEPASAAPMGRTISLVVINSGRRITLDANDDLLIGRKDNARGIYPDVDLGLDDGYDAGVSRRHAVLSPTQSGWMVEDLGSANGTFLNGKQLHPQRRTPVRTGDELKLGSLLLRIEA